VATKRPAPAKFRSLSVTLTRAFVGLSVAILLVVGALSAYFAVQAQAEAIANHQQLVAQNAANTVQGFVQNRLIELRLTAHLGNLLGITPSGQEVVMEKLLGLEPDFRTVSLLDSHGNQMQLASELSIYGPSQPQDTAAILAQTQTGKDYISPVYIDKTTFEPQIVLATPVTDAFGDFKGVLTAELNLKSMWDVVDQINVGGGGQAYVVDSSGYLIAYSDTTRVIAHENLSRLPEVSEFIHGMNTLGLKDVSISKGIKNTLVASLHVSLGTPNWAVVIEVPVLNAYAPVVSNLASSLLVIVLSALIAAIAGFFLSRRITRPILELKDVAKKIGAGDLSARSDIVSTNEIGELAAAFNTMTQDLQDTGRKFYEEHARLVASIDGLEVGYIMTGSDNQIVLINNAARQLVLGESVQENTNDLSFQTIAELLKTSIDLPNTLKSCLDKWQVVDVKEVNYGNRVLHIFAGPILAKSATDKVTPIGCVILLEDITESIVAARSKDEFFSIASHELRTPLTAIRGNSSMMMQYYADVLKDPTLKEMLSDIYESSNRLIAIVNDFLDVSRIEQGKIKFDFVEVELDKMVQQVSDEMKVALKEQKISIKVEPKTLGHLPKVAGDANRIKQVIYNLVGNAVKFTEPGGAVTVSTAKFKAESGDMLKVAVADTGRGIPIDAQKLLFRKFQQAGSSIITRDTARGTGLGLYISKLLVEGMGGEISLEKSEEGKGSTFAFTLPVATPGQLQKLQETETKKGPTDAKTGLAGAKTPPSLS
jgi:signal transduction histidine kinase